MAVATPWYEAVVVTGDAPVVIGVLAIIATVWATFRAAKPRQGLVYRVVSSRPVTDSDPAEVRTLLKEHYFARIMEIRLRGRGRHDIPSSAFDDAQPIIIYMNYGEILMLIDEPLSIPIERSAPKAEVITDGPAAPGVGCLAIGPGLIGRDQIITYTVVAYSVNRPADVPVLDVRHSFIDVQVKPRIVVQRFAPFIGVIITAAILVGLSEVVIYSHPSPAIEETLVFSLFIIGLIAVVLVLVVVARTLAWTWKRTAPIRRRSK